MTAAIVITGAPGSGKSSVAQAFTTLLDNAGIEHGAIESEQLAWGTPWLPDSLVHEQLAAARALQRGYGRRLFVVVATTETQADLDGLLAAVGASRTLVAACSRRATSARRGCWSASRSAGPAARRSPPTPVRLRR